MVFMLRSVRASCLEKAVLLQRFDAATGKARAVIIGVTAPGRGFRAHAWLEGERQTDTAFHEIVRHRTPVSWLSAPTAQ